MEFSVCQYCNGAHTDKMADRTLGATSREIDKQIEQISFVFLQILFHFVTLFQGVGQNGIIRILACCHTASISLLVHG